MWSPWLTLGADPFLDVTGEFFVHDGIGTTRLQIGDDVRKHPAGTGVWDHR